MASPSSNRRSAICVVLFLCVPAFTSPLIFKLYGWNKLKDEFSAHPWTWPAISVLTIGAYSLALWAYSISPLGYAGSIREVSVVMAALQAGSFWEKNLAACVWQAQ